MDNAKVDLDEGRIYVDDEWLSSEELKYAIKTKISSDDFDVEHLSRAMKELKQIMDESTTIEIRVTNSLHVQLKDQAEDSGDTVGAIVRKVLEGYIGGDVAPVEEDEKPKKRGGRKKKAEVEEEPEDEPEDEPEEEEEEPEDEPEDEPEEEEEPEAEAEEESEDDLEVEHISRRRRRSPSSGSRR